MEPKTIGSATQGKVILDYFTPPPQKSGGAPFLANLGEGRQPSLSTPSTGQWFCSCRGWWRRQTAPLPPPPQTEEHRSSPCRGLNGGAGLLQHVLRQPGLGNLVCSNALLVLQGIVHKPIKDFWENFARLAKYLQSGSLINQGTTVLSGTLKVNFPCYWKVNFWLQ